MSDSSITLYTLLFIIGSYFAFKSQRRAFYGTNNIRLIWFIASYLVLWFFFAFNDVGADTPQYRVLFEYSDSNEMNYYTGAVEPGYIFVNYLVHFLTHNPIWGVAIIRTIQITIVFLSIYLLRNRIIIGFAVMGYMALYYFGSFNILRLALASSICMLCYACVVNRYNKFIIVILALLPFFIHRSSLVFPLTILLFLIYGKFQRRYGKFIRILIVTGCIIVISLVSVILQDILSMGFGEGRYDAYLDTNGSAGVMVFVFYVPLIYCILKSGKEGVEYDANWVNLSFIFTIIGFSIAIMGYQVGMLARMAPYFAMPMLFYMSNYLISVRSGKYITGLRSNFNYQQGAFLLFFYYFIRFVINIRGSYIPDGLMGFKFVFN